MNILDRNFREINKLACFRKLFFFSIFQIFFLFKNINSNKRAVSNKGVQVRKWTLKN